MIDVYSAIFLSQVHAVLAAASLEARAVDRIVLVGGATRMPRVRQTIGN